MLTENFVTLNYGGAKFHVIIGHLCVVAWILLSFMYNIVLFQIDG